jgi:hypothetical protein
MSFWEKVWNKFRAAALKQKTPFLAPEQVDVKYDAEPIAQGAAYCRLWLSEMRLARGVDWFKSFYPMVYTAISYQYDGKQVTVPYIAGVDYFKGLGAGNLDRVVSQRFPLTPLFPFTRDLVGIKAGVFGMQTNDPIQSAIETMGKFASLLPVPELSQVVKIAEELNSGIEKLFDVGAASLQLGYQDTFSARGGGGNNDLRPGYFAVILTPETSFADNRLRVIKDALYLLPEGGGAPVPLTGYNYMLFRLEKRTEQDWEALKSINELVQRAQDAVTKKQMGEAKEILTAIRIAIMRSPDVVKSDRKVMFDKIEAELKDLGLQGKQVQMRSLYEIMQRPMPAPGAAAGEAWDRLEKLVRKEA